MWCITMNKVYKETKQDERTMIQQKIEVHKVKWKDFLSKLYSKAFVRDMMLLSCELHSSFLDFFA